MKRRILIGFLFLLFHGFWAIPAQAENRFIVRVLGGLPLVQKVCATLGCNVVGALDGLLGQVFLVTTPDSTPPSGFLPSLLSQLGVINVELDLRASTSGSGYSIPAALLDTLPVNHFGTMVPHGYVNQPATRIIRLSDTQTAFSVKGAGTVAVIDTGVDPSHPTLQAVLVPGYDFIRGQQGEADERKDLGLATQPGLQGGQPAWVNQSTAAVVDQSTAAVVDGNPQYSSFGHGTMVAGVIHLVAPTAKLMPLKAFRADGTGYTSDILRAIYWATQRRANVINMSFSLPAYSQEVNNALNLATLQGIVCVASAGNNGQNIPAYPAAMRNVMGVGSTTDADQRSSFSNYGQDNVWVAAPGEGIVTTYPFGTYAAVWGTSFSAPLVSGVAALMLDGRPSIIPALLFFLNYSRSAQSMANAQPLGPDLGHGRLDAYQAVRTWRQLMGMQ